MPTTTRTLSEQDSKHLLADYGVPFAHEVLVADGPAAAAAVAAVGSPCALKLCGDAIAHKTERGLVRLGVAEVEAASVAEELLAAGRPEDGVTGVLVAEMVRGSRELIAGVARDPQFGPTLLLGVGGVLAEAVADVAVRVLPVERVDALEMLEQLELQPLLGAFRGEPAVDAEAVADVLMALAAAARARPDLVSVDLNPLVVRDGRPVAVDALVELEGDDA